MLSILSCIGRLSTNSAHLFINCPQTVLLKRSGSSARATNGTRYVSG